MFSQLPEYRNRLGLVGTELEIATLEFLLQAVRRPEQPDRRLVLAELARIFARIDDFAIRLFQFAFVFLDKTFATPVVPGRNTSACKRTAADV